MSTPSATSSSAVLTVPTAPPTQTPSTSISTSRSTPVATSTPQSSAPVITATSNTSSSISTSTSTSTSTTPTSSAVDTSSSNASSRAPVASTTGSPSVTPGVTSIINGTTASTYTQFVSAPSASATRNVPPSQANTSFFANKGAVIGVFTVVGLIGVAVFIAIVTACIRRRRAKRFDMDVEEAAREAAATSAAHHPFADDDYTSYGRQSSADGGRRTGYTGYSAESHGSYEQPPMSLGGRAEESYVMSDVGGTRAYDSRYPSVAAGAAGIGAAVGAAAMQRARSRRENAGGGSGFGDYPQTQERTPYPAFVAGPTAAAAPNHEMPDQSSSGSGGNTMRFRRGTGGRTPDLLEAAGLLSGASAGTAGMGSPSRRLSEQAQYSDLSRNTSQGQGQGRESEEMGYPANTNSHLYMQATVPSRESYIGNGPYHVVYPLPPPQQQPGTYTPEPPTPSEDPFRRNTMPVPVSVSAVMPDDHADDEEDAYGGYADDGDVEGRHHREGSDESRYSDLHRRGREGEGEGRSSFHDEEDYGRQPRVLKVANE